MPRPNLTPCPQCARHVRESEPRCPFCSAAFGDALRSPRVTSVVRGRWSRAALYALGASGMTFVAGCESVHMQPLYGAPPIDSGEPVGNDAASDARDADVARDAGDTDAADGSEVDTDASDGSIDDRDAADAREAADSAGD